MSCPDMSGMFVIPKHKAKHLLNFARFFGIATPARNVINPHSEVYSLRLLPLSEGSMQNICLSFHNQNIFHTNLALSCNYMNIIRFVNVLQSSFGSLDEKGAVFLFHHCQFIFIYLFFLYIGIILSSKFKTFPQGSLKDLLFQFVGFKG